MLAGGGWLLVPWGWLVWLGGWCFFNSLEMRCFDGPKADILWGVGMLLKYWLSTEGGFVGEERVNPVGVLVSGGLPWHLMSGVVTGGDMTRSCDEVVMWGLLPWCLLTVLLCGLQLWTLDSLLMLLLLLYGLLLYQLMCLYWLLLLLLLYCLLWLYGMLYWLQWLNVLLLLHRLLTSLASGAVAACFAVEPGRGSAVELVHVSE